MREGGRREGGRREGGRERGRDGGWRGGRRGGRGGRSKEQLPIAYPDIVRTNPLGSKNVVRVLCGAVDLRALQRVWDTLSNHTVC